MTFLSDVRRSVKAIRNIIERRRSEAGDAQLGQTLAHRFLDVSLRTWDLGFTAFGGPPVHFQILHSRFVDGKGGDKWLDEQTYQELFAICQALPGPASTKMLFCIALLRGGVIPAVFIFLLWSLPGALVMFGLALGVQKIGEVLPSPVYALLTGLNASTVGIIALAAVQLAEKAITDDLTRILVIFGACAGMCYSALWYFPVLMAVGGITSAAWYGFVQPQISNYRIRRRERSAPPESVAEQSLAENAIPLSNLTPPPEVVHRRAHASTPLPQSLPVESNDKTPITVRQDSSTTPDASPDHGYTVSVRTGVLLIVSFFALFLAVLLIRGLVRPLPLEYSLFSNMFLAGTIIFGGGPVVIPLLRSYVVDPGWVSSRDFLFGLAIIQAMPGPNFNFAVYLGALALQGSSTPTIVGSLIAWVGINYPGLTFAVAVQGFWRIMRRKQWVRNVLKGVNAAAVGLVFTAVYRLWEIGYLTPENSRGQSLGLNPWWVVVTTLTYAQSAWFKVPPPVAILIGAILGLCKYGAVGN